MAVEAPAGGGGSMKLFLLRLLFLLTPSLLIGQYLEDTDTWEVEEIYQIIDVPFGALGLFWGGYEELSNLLVPTDIDKGVYQIQLEEIAENLYQIRGTDICLKLKHSYLANKYSLKGIGTTVFFDNTTLLYGSKGKVYVKSAF